MLEDATDHSLQNNSYGWVVEKQVNAIAITKLQQKMAIARRGRFCHYPSDTSEIIFQTCPCKGRAIANEGIFFGKADYTG
ncbi:MULTISPECIES: hypothetical protein [unclassified Leptolyngbya]|uniref:hypothetical protein n=1 Tax=unclassified Leptolyngbya TaxID=2650499 RepID=UPI0016822957|nr:MULTISPECIES: hypothetical protein [unclassified Leptolyngbya]MBD1913849.1 hypothetical protein [Leptolyngbya sp. FACHB-8]MBD2157359.1 hypothetical protein [Leptolyngbya sp. FACHB-16]